MTMKFPMVTANTVFSLWHALLPFSCNVLLISSKISPNHLSEDGVYPGLSMLHNFLNLACIVCLKGKTPFA